MYTAEHYFLGWFVYSAGVICLLYVGWQLLRSRNSVLRHLLLLILAVLFLTPVTAYMDDPHLAPAFFVSFYEGLVVKPSLGFQRGAAPIAAMMTVTVLLYTLSRFIIWRIRR
jgi:putative flippase GtrA